MPSIASLEKQLREHYPNFGHRVINDTHFLGKSKHLDMTSANMLDFGPTYKEALEGAIKEVGRAANATRLDFRRVAA